MQWYISASTLEVRRKNAKKMQICETILDIEGSTFFQMK